MKYDLNKSKVNLVQQDEGGWFDYMEFAHNSKLVLYTDDIEDKPVVKIASLRSYQVNKILSEIELEIYPPNSAITAELSDKVNIELCVRALIKDWKNLELDGKDFPYSIENCRKIVQDESYHLKTIALQAARATQLLYSESLRDKIKK